MQTISFDTVVLTHLLVHMNVMDGTVWQTSATTTTFLAPQKAKNEVGPFPKVWRSKSWKSRQRKKTNMRTVQLHASLRADYWPVSEWL